VVIWVLRRQEKLTCFEKKYSTQIYQLHLQLLIRKLPPEHYICDLWFAIYFTQLQWLRSWSSVADIAATLLLGRSRGLYPAGGKRFFYRPKRRDLLWDPRSLLLNGCRRYFPRVKRRRCEVKLWPSSTEFKNAFLARTGKLYHYFLLQCHICRQFKIIKLQKLCTKLKIVYHKLLHKQNQPIAEGASQHVVNMLAAQMKHIGQKVNFHFSWKSKFACNCKPKFIQESFLSLLAIFCQHFFLH
jgi:hypothetical protein